MAAFTIDVVSDVVCPWCYLGKRRLDAALANLGETEAEIRWRPYQLDETIPRDGMDRKLYMQRKFGDLSRLEPVHERLESYGSDLGMHYDFEAIQRAPNTLDAHRLIRWADDPVVQAALVDALFRAYFEQGRDIGDAETLVDIAAANGMDASTVRERLAGADDIGSVKDEIDAWRRAGVSGVPFFIFDGRLAVSGAQSVDTLVAAMVEARHAPKAD